MKVIPAFQITKSPENGVVGAEVLARWRYKGKLLSPRELHEKGPVNWASVDLEIMGALITLAPILGTMFPRIFLNVSPQTLSFADVRDRWFDMLQELRAKSDFVVVVEITEQVTPDQLAVAWPIFQRLNIDLALDDFGDHYSSVRRLASYPWKYCKLEVCKLRGLAGNMAV